MTTFAQLHELGCKRTGADRQSDVRKAEKQHGGMFATLTRFGQGNVCSGCPEVGKCKAFRTINPSAAPIVADVDPHLPSNSPNYPGLIVCQIAEKLGVSMNEVKRRKSAGTL